MTSEVNGYAKDPTILRRMEPVGVWNWQSGPFLPTQPQMTSKESPITTLQWYCLSGFNPWISTAYSHGWAFVGCIRPSDSVSVVQSPTARYASLLHPQLGSTYLPDITFSDIKSMIINNIFFSVWN